MIASDHSVELKGEDERSRGWLSRILVVFALLAGAGGVAAIKWTSAGGASFRSLMEATAAPFVAERPTKGDTEALHQQIVVLVTAQQAEIKRLTDQVAKLSGKLDQLQRPVASAPNTIPTVKSAAPALPPKKRIEASKSVATAKPAERELFDIKPTGAVSTGGAPLPIELLTTPRPVD